MDPFVQRVLPSRSSPDGVGDLHRTYLVTAVFLVLMAGQAVGYLALGTDRSGRCLSEFLIILQHLLAMGCAAIAFRRARGTAALFWLLFLVTDLVLLIPNTILAFSTLLGHSLVSDATWRALYILYGAPVLMTLILPDFDRGGRMRSEVFLDLFQVALVVSLAFSAFFYLPLQQMLPADAFRQNLTVSNLESLVLLAAVLVRLKFTRVPAARDRILRLGLFVLACAVVTFIGNWIDQHHYVAAASWWDLGWDIPILLAGIVAVAWQDSPAKEEHLKPASLLGLVGKNLALVTVLCCLHLGMDRVNESHGKLITGLAVAASLLAFMFRLALTQFHQQQEIAEREAAQSQLTAANGKISGLLEDARRQTAEITQISELGSLLQACSSPDEAYRLIPERLRRLFDNASGSLSLLSSSRNRVESVAQWGVDPPTDQIFSPEECWALRRGCAHAVPAGSSALRCSHLLCDGASVCIPLIANGAAIGTLAMQSREGGTESALGVQPASESDAFVRRCQLVNTVGEHIALALANLDLREALRVQSVRDPLTGLYNRRCMQEFLEREAHRAHRKRRSLSVMMLDLDYFKRFNDANGHAAGDRALQLVGETLMRSVRADDVACRYGGEEFALILLECTMPQAIARAEQIRERVKQCRLERTGEAAEFLTVSIGLAALNETTDRVDLLLRCADEALYQAKREGRDRVVAARPIAGTIEPNAKSASSASS